VPLLTVEERPFNAETPLGDLSQAITPADLFFVRTHFDIPKLDPSEYRLAVEDGLRTVAPLTLSEIHALPARTITATLECAGNGRMLLEPPVPGVRWGFGAVSTARFTGASLHHLLERAGIPDSAAEILFVGADSGDVEPDRKVAFERSLPVSWARHPDTILAWELNGEPLTSPHGFPLRLVVPRWYAVASVKWITRIRFLKEPFQGHFQTEKYRYQSESGIPENSPVAAMRVRALVSRPFHGETLALGRAEIRGVAWSGEAPIREVEVSFDGGGSWRSADLERPSSEHSWTPWHIDWTPPSPGDYAIVSRATDAAGNTQPLSQAWNAQGYGNNAVQRVDVRIR
jgi:DMSO/TMAO reductase YedYZ molybdopterin-dependent catalytic subunit